jgi:N-acetylmuramoyl-L-alanine amidase
MNKKIITLLIVIIIGISNANFALDYSAHDSLTNKIISFEQIIVNFDGEELVSDMPAILYINESQTRTLIPLRAVLEKIGATVEWVDETSSIIIKKDDKEIIMKVNSPVATVNGEEITLPSGIPPILLTKDKLTRTLVPTRFIVEEFGMKIDYNNTTNEVDIVSNQNTLNEINTTVSDYTTVVEFSFNSKPEYKTLFIDGTKSGSESYYIIDFKIENMDPSTINYLKDLDLSPISSIHHEGLIQDTYERFVLTLNKNVSFKDNYDEITNKLSFKTISLLDNITVSEGSIVIHSTASTELKISKFNSKLILDFLNSKMSIAGGTYGNLQGNSYISNVSYSQYDSSTSYPETPLVSRVVLTLANDVNYDDIEVTPSGELVIVVKKIINKNSIIINSDINESSFSLLTDKSNLISSYYDESNKLFYLYYPKGSMNIETGAFETLDSRIESYKVDNTTLSDMDLIEIKLLGDYKIETSIQISSFTVNISENEIEDNIPLIVIDPGHGGVWPNGDPGAISTVTKTYEKTINLSVGILLKKVLEEAGYRVEMTRNDDTYQSLYNRAEIANRLEADLFISLHANSNPDTTMKGVQIIYQLDKDDTPRDSEILAKEIMAQLVNDLGVVDKGLKNRPEIVVTRETKMDSVLVEMGFLTNATEELNLINPEYQQKIANSILEAIKNYLQR